MRDFKLLSAFRFLRSWLLLSAFRFLLCAMESLAGVEPATIGFQVQRSNQLSYSAYIAITFSHFANEAKLNYAGIRTFTVAL